MRYDHGTRENRQRASFLLGDLRRKLRSFGDANERPLTMQSETTTPYWRMSNVAGVHVYRVAEGWHADLAFKNLPAGMPTLTGTAAPLGTRQEALDSAVRQLTLCVQREKLPLPEEVTRWRWFVFDELEVPVDPENLPGTAARLEREGYSGEEAVGRLAYLRHLMADDEPLTVERLEAADEETRVKLVVACEDAMALGRTQFSLADGIWAEHAPTAPGMM